MLAQVRLVFWVQIPPGPLRPQPEGPVHPGIVCLCISDTCIRCGLRNPCRTHRPANRPSRSEVAALSDLVGFANPCGKLFVELVGRGNAKMVHKQSLRVRIGSPYAWIAHSVLEIEVPIE